MAGKMDPNLRTFLETQTDSGKLLIPSALRTDGRCTLNKKNPVEYSQMYHEAYMEKNVWRRLMKDARRRDDTRPKEGTYQRTPTTQHSTLSGFATNNRSTKGYLPPPTAAGHDDPEITSLHSTTLRSYRKHYPIEFMSAIRPKTNTINETLGMW
eukprot:CAMPEP_0117672140 /NCGR_PEP_ID=MMETSP0804-20121206/13735_1 /TAXON_ID=1074897 /ORGANISM="Tetraselmis astigmatica, Strain CCMP880" /LENGTH=153 /DNA_ID=CAMNT_0005480701 /DNA_START=151 /DNA_END=609 /DNA_ORIENTATION=+